MPTELASIATVTRRPAQSADEPFVRALFATGRDDLAILDPAVRGPLLDIQFRAQRRQYCETYPDARYEILGADRVDVGELIVDHGPAAVRIVDVTVDPAQRGRGIGTAVLLEEIAAAERAGVPITLSVWSANLGARRLYERLGFFVTEQCDGSDGYFELRRDSGIGRS